MSHESRRTLRVIQKFFSQRAVNDWNQLPQLVVDATPVNMIKNRPDGPLVYGHGHLMLLLLLSNTTTMRRFSAQVIPLLRQLY